MMSPLLQRPLSGFRWLHTWGLPLEPSFIGWGISPPQYVKSQHIDLALWLSDFVPIIPQAGESSPHLLGWGYPHWAPLQGIEDKKGSSLLKCPSIIQEAEVPQLITKVSVSIYVCICVSMCLCVLVHACVYITVSMYAYTYMWFCVHVCVWYAHVCTCVCLLPLHRSSRECQACLSPEESPG